MPTPARRAMPSIDIRAKPTAASSSKTAARIASVLSSRSTAAPAGVRRAAAESFPLPSFAMA